MDRTIKIIISILLWCALFSTVRAETKPEGMVYFWHRVRGKKTDEALKPFCNWRVYALFAEFREDKSAALLKYQPGTVPVIRLDRSCWREKDFMNFFVPNLKRLPLGEIQLDCDVPESKINAYAEFLKQLKTKMKGYTFSITILPCHLKHKNLSIVLEQVDYAVLQLHALEAPQNLPNEYKLFDFDTADKAVAEMKKFRKPFRIALPGYAYVIHYTKDGKFRRMSAENELQPRSDEIRKQALPNWNDILKLRRKYPEIEVIWFRLPMKGDRLTLEAENLIRLNQGKLPRTEVEVIKKENKSCTDVYLKNHGLPGRVRYTMPLPGSGEIFCFNKTELIVNKTCAVPKSLTVELPPPGETILIAKILNWDKNKND